MDSKRIDGLPKCAIVLVGGPVHGAMFGDYDGRKRIRVEARPDTHDAFRVYREDGKPPAYQPPEAHEYEFVSADGATAIAYYAWSGRNGRGCADGSELRRYTSLMHAAMLSDARSAAERLQSAIYRRDDEITTLREQLRRAELLTPESVKAICERDGLSDDEGSDGYDPERPEYTDYGCSISVGRVGESPYWSVGDTASFAIGEMCLTVGQLEDAIAAAKGANDE